MKVGITAVLALPLLAIAVSALFWADDKKSVEPSPSTPGSIKFRVCNTTVSGSPEKFESLPDALEVVNSMRPDGPEDFRLQPTMSIGRSTGPNSGFSYKLRMNPRNGEILQGYGSADEREAFLDLLKTKRVNSQIQPMDLTWPFTDVAQVPERMARLASIRYREPDPGSGLATHHWYERGSNVVTEYVGFSNCRSRMIIVNRVGAVGTHEVFKDVVDGDRDAFERLLGTVEYRNITPR
jgi:hypothetical protein